MIPLSKRLQAVVDWIDGDVLADIGCDHGYVCIESILSHKVSKAYACDIAKGPLENAMRSIEKYNCSNSISCLLMDGMENLPDDVDVVVIAGMGSSTIIEILSACTCLKSGMKFICTPHKDVESFRLFCMEHGFHIQKERMVYEDHHYYPVLSIVYDGNPYSLNEEEILYGVSILKDATYSFFG